MLGVFWGSILGVVILIIIVRTLGRDGGVDPSGWAWIDVVSTHLRGRAYWSD